MSEEHQPPPDLSVVGSYNAVVHGSGSATVNVYGTIAPHLGDSCARERPLNYIPDLRDNLFQARRREFEQLEKLVIEAKALGTPLVSGLLVWGE